MSGRENIRRVEGLEVGIDSMRVSRKDVKCVTNVKTRRRDMVECYLKTPRRGQRAMTGWAKCGESVRNATDRAGRGSKDYKL